MNLRQLFQRKQPSNPVTRDLKKLAQSVGNEVYKYAAGQIAQVPKNMLKAAKAARLPVEDQPYLFWLLANPSHWNTMSKPERQALLQVTFVMDKVNAMPDYSSNFQMPEVESEEKVENVLTATAKWAANNLHRDLLAHTLKLIKTKAAAAGVEKAELEAVFLVSVKRDPRLFKYPDFVYWVVQSFIV